MTILTDREKHLIRIAHIKLKLGIPLTDEEWAALKIDNAKQ